MQPSHALETVADLTRATVAGAANPLEDVVQIGTRNVHQMAKILNGFVQTSCQRLMSGIY